MKHREKGESRGLWLLLPALVMLALSAGAKATGPDGIDESLASDDLRLRLEDPRQELHTTSVNFSDLLPYQVSKAPRQAAMVPGALVPVPDEETRRPKRTRFRVLVDIGHGGRDLGALGVSGVLEKDLCLRIGKLVRESLRRYPRVKGLPLEVKLSRDGDRYLTLHDRVKLANEWGADLFVSIHANASAYAKARGFEVYFLSSRATDSSATRLARVENDGQPQAPVQNDVLSMLSDAQNNYHLERSSDFAERVFQAMARRLKTNARGVRQGPFTVIAGTTMPAILIEVGYVTDRQEAKLLGNEVYLKHLAGAISTGIIDFANTVGELG